MKREESLRKTLNFALNLMVDADYQHETAKQCVRDLAKFCFDQLTKEVTLTPEEIDFLRQGRKIPALRSIKDRTGSSLYEARDILHENMMLIFGTTLLPQRPFE